MSAEFSPAQNNQEIWDAALAAAREGQAEYMGYMLGTVPPHSENPEQITLTLDVDGQYKAGSRVLTIGQTGPVGYAYDILYWDDDKPEEVAKNFGPEDPQTLQELASLADRIRDWKVNGERYRREHQAWLARLHLPEERT